MSHSVSILLPVHNLQSGLRERVLAILEIMADLSARFEILILDDGSTDLTHEVAVELSVEYPQVRVLRCASRRGTAVAVQRGIEATAREIIFVDDSSQRFSQAALYRLWQLRDEHDLVMARLRFLDEQPVLDRFDRGNFGQRDLIPDQSGSLQMVRRRAMLEVMQQPAAMSLAAADSLTRTDLPASSAGVRPAPNLLTRLHSAPTARQVDA